jgi:hypothetical protein
MPTERTAQLRDTFAGASSLSTLTFCGHNNSYSSSDLLSTTNLNEHELIFFSPSGLFAEIKAGQQIVSAEVHSQVILRMIDIQRWVERGHTLIVLDPRPLRFRHVGTNAVEANGSIEIFPPLNQVQLTQRSGFSIQAVSEKGIAELLGSHIALKSYEVVLSGASLMPLLTVKASSRIGGRPEIVAGYLKLGDGLVVFSPAWAGPGKPYCCALEQLPSLLANEKPELPGWIDNFQTTSEESNFGEIESKKADVRRLEETIATLEADVNKARQLKRLFAGTGTSFEVAVADAFRELGLQVVVGPHPRADLLITNGERLAAVEAKGIDGAAREDYVRQVTMWMPEVDTALLESQEATAGSDIDRYREQLKLLDLTGLNRQFDCKGILVLGTFRTLPLNQRTQPDFPSNIVKVLEHRDVCALTGIQLYCLLMLARSNENLKEQIRSALFDTAGVLAMGSNWQEVLWETSA